MLIAIATSGYLRFVQVVAVVDVVHIDIVIVIPVIPPRLRPRVNGADPIAVVLESRISTYDQEGQAVDTELMARAKVSAETAVWDAIAAVSPTLSPRAVVGVPVL